MMLPVLLLALSAGAPSLSMSAFAPQPGASDAALELSGRVRLHSAIRGGSRVFTDRFHLLDPGEGFPGLPPFDLSLQAVDGELVPAIRTPVANDTSPWELIVSPGRAWRDAGEAADRAAIPFALKEKNADCLHYGVLTFMYDSAGARSPASFLISSETCMYLQFDAWGAYDVDVTPATPTNNDAIAERYRIERDGRLETRPIGVLEDDYPGGDPTRFGSPDEVNPAEMTTYGLVIDDRHYVGDCRTRRGDYPYCDGLPLPSYSLAKSLFAGLAMMRAERISPGAADALIRDHVAACREVDAWQGVTIGHALDMATGNYDSLEPLADEDAMIASEFFLADLHATKIAAACNAFPRRSVPGERWVYHTSDTYIAGTALASYLRGHVAPGLDLYTDIIVEPLWVPLGLSPLSHATRRSNDDIQQPYTGWGLSFLRDDIARIGLFLGRDRGRIRGKAVLDEALFAAAMAPVEDDPGLPADIQGMRYNNGFRVLDVAPYLGCSEPTWVPVLSGYGGIIVILLPNDTVYYYFSDGGSHRWMSAARESNRIRPFCR